MKNIRIVLLLSLVLVLAACGRTSGGVIDRSVSDLNAEDTAVSTSDIEIGETLEEQPADTRGDFVVSVQDRVFFAFDSAELAADAAGVLDAQADWLKANSSVLITIEGHADERGTREYNLALSERRANTVREYLVNAGIDAARIRTIGYGKERPEALGADEAAWSKNRRGVTVVGE